MTFAAFAQICDKDVKDKFFINPVCVVKFRGRKCFNVIIVIVLTANFRPYCMLKCCGVHIAFKNLFDLCKIFVLQVPCTVCLKKNVTLLKWLPN